MLIRMSVSRRAAAVVACGWCLMGVVAAASGQTAMEVRLDVLLGSDQVLPERVEGPVWSLEAAPGRRLVQLPIRLTPGSEEETIKKPAYEFQAGRFLCWVIPDAHQEATGRARTGATPKGPSNEELDDLASLLRRPSQQEAASASNGGMPMDGLDTLGGGGVPEGAPRCAREIVVRPDGTVAWSMDRAVPGQVRSGEEPYMLKLDAARLRELQPERPDRLTRNNGEDQRAFAVRQREADMAYRDASQAFRDLQTLARDLPESFEEELPDVVWAVFEVNVLGNALTLRGSPDGDWSLPLEDLAVMQSMAGTGGGRRASAGADDGVVRLQRLVADPHPWTQRLVSAALCGSGQLDQASVGDGAYSLATKLLGSPDTLARNRVIYTLAKIQPPTSATASLLKQSASQSGEQVVQLAAMSAQLAVDMAGQPEGGQNQGLSAAIATTNAMLRDANGPDAGMVVEQFLQATAAPTGRASGPAQASDAQTAAINGVRFDGLPPERFDAAVAAVLRSVGDRPVVASGWLDRQLLGSNDRAVVTRTMELMARADAPSAVVHPIATGLSRLVFGSPADGEANEALDLTMTGAASIESANHALFRLLNAGDASTKALAWQVLRHFELTDQPVSTGRNAPAVPAAGGLDPLTQIVNAGLGTPATPGSLVPFLARQPDTLRTTEPLTRVVSDGDVSSSRRASRVLVGSGRQLGQTLEAMSPDARVRFANRVYDRLGDGAEPVTGLLRIEQGAGVKVVKWFGDELAAGTLPSVADWAPAAGGEDELLRLAVSRDEALGLGAIAALTAAAGGDRAMQNAMITRFKPQRNTLDTEAMREAWTSAKQDIYTQRLAQAAGKYRMVIEVTGEVSGEGGLMFDPVLGTDPTGAPPTPPTTEGAATKRAVAVVALVAKGATVGFAGGTPELTVPSERLAMRIATPGQIKNWPLEELNDLPLDQVKEPLDLLPEDNGVWRGSVVLPDGRRLELALEPFGGAAKDDATPTDTKATDGPAKTDTKPASEAPGRITPSDKDQAIDKNPFNR